MSYEGVPSSSVKLSAPDIRKICKDRGISLTDALAQAGVSRTAYYALLRRSTVLPASLTRLAKYLRVPPSYVLLEPEDFEVSRAKEIALEAERIARKTKVHDIENVRHALLLLDLTPAERMARGLRRRPGPGSDSH